LWIICNLYAIDLGASSYYSWLKYKESQTKSKQPVLPTTQQDVDGDTHKNGLLNGIDSAADNDDSVDDVDNDSNEMGRLTPRTPTSANTNNQYHQRQPSSNSNTPMTSMPNYRPQIIDNIGAMTPPNAYINSNPIRPAAAGYAAQSSSAAIGASTSSGRSSPTAHTAHRRYAPHTQIGNTGANTAFHPIPSQQAAESLR
jgi:hypothetical protein